MADKKEKENKQNKQKKLKAELHSLLQDSNVSLKGKSTHEINQLTLNAIKKKKDADIIDDEERNEILDHKEINKPFICACGIEVTIFSDEVFTQNKCSACV